jgi:hypothetical protein
MAKNFVALMDMHMPDWRTTKEMLNGFVLDKYEGIRGPIMMTATTMND